MKFLFSSLSFLILPTNSIRRIEVFFFFMFKTLSYMLKIINLSYSVFKVQVSNSMMWMTKT